VYESADNT